MTLIIWCKSLVIGSRSSLIRPVFLYDYLLVHLTHRIALNAVYDLQHLWNLVRGHLLFKLRTKAQKVQRLSPRPLLDNSSDSLAPFLVGQAHNRNFLNGIQAQHLPFHL